jgi:hypothetical protein
MRKILLLIVVLVVLLLILASCGFVPSQNLSPTADTTAITLAVTASRPTPLSSPTTRPTPLPSPTVVAPNWKTFPLVDSPFQVVFANESQEYQRKEIYGSGVALNTDTRWVIDVQVDKLIQDVGEASTGIVFNGYLENGVYQNLYLVYQWGKWSLGYQPDSTSSNFTYWRTMEGLRTPEQHFELTISHDGKRITLINDRGFRFQDTFPNRIFDGAYVISTWVQIGPQTKITLSRLSVEQLQNEIVASTSLPADFMTPTAIASGNNQPEYVFYVAPSGNDNNPGTSDKPFATIEHARDVVRTINETMHGDIVVYVHGGTYSISQPIQFSEEDSGQNGYNVIYRAVEGESPVLSGGVEVSGWQQLPNSQIWKTVLNDVKSFRQLYVNGVRAQRAVSQEPITGLSWKAGSFSDRDGIIVSANKLPNLSRPQDLELHWIYDWNDMRLLVQSIEKNSDGTITIWMKQPYFSYALWMGSNDHDWYPKYSVPFYLENALELLDNPGEWYYNPDTHELFYMPREDENMNNVKAVIPQTQTLIEITGGLVGQEVHNISFEGLSFYYTGWTRASEIGTFGWQAQDLIRTPGWGQYSQEMTPAAIRINSAHEIRFERCRFEHLGAVGLELVNNVYNVTVQGNLFHDISDGAIVVGHWDHAYITTPSVQAASHNNLLANNLINDVGVEYWGAPAITAYYVNNIEIIHNEISNVPYTGISVGWGWSSTTDSTTSHDNHIAYNLVTDLTQRARDGGGIYTLGQQPGTVIEGNVVRRMKGDYACFYPDEGSAYIVFKNNVCDTAPQWLHLWTNTIHDIRFLNTYTNVRREENRGVNIQIENKVYINGQAWTPEAQAIIDSAGLETEYYYLHNWLNNE